MPLTRPKHRQINTTSAKFTDPLLEVNSELAGGNVNDMGLIMNRGTSGDNAAIIWDRSTEEFVLCTTTATGASSGDIAIGAYANLRVNQLQTAGLTYPTVDGTNGQVLSTNGNGALSFVDQTSGIANVEADTAPNLGGDLGMNGYDISMPAGSAINGDPNVTLNGADTGTAFGGNILAYAGDGTTIGGAVDVRAGNSPTSGGSIDLNVGYGTTSNTVGVVRVRSLGGTEAPPLEFREKSSGGSGNWIRLKAPDDTNNNRTWVLPQDDPSTVNGQFLTTDASGNLSFSAQTAEVNDLTAAVTWANVPDANITQSSVTQHQAALSITESQISDLTHFGGTVNDLTDVANTTPADKHVLIYDGVTDNRYENRLLVEADISDLQAYLTAETNDLTAAVTWANVPDANITQTSVTQHQAALSITESQISDLQAYLTAETNDLTAAVTWANVPDANITQSSVTQHQAALSVTESQISDLGNYAATDVANTFTTNQVIETSSTSAALRVTQTGTGHALLVEDAANPDASPFYIDNAGNCVIAGDLTVNGTTTTVNTETINLADNTILLNSNETGTPTQNGGIEIERGTEANKSFLWDETNDRWTTNNEQLVVSDLVLTGEIDGPSDFTVSNGQGEATQYSETNNAIIWSTVGTERMRLTSGGVDVENALTIKNGGANQAATGAIKLTNNHGIGWRNNANTADIKLSVNASDQLVLGSDRILTVADEGTGNGLDADTLDGQEGTYYNDATNLTNTDTMTQQISTSNQITSGRGSGGVSLTVNDGGGNANVTFNHYARTPEQAGNVGRIHVNTDSTTGATMTFQVKSNTGTAVISADTILSLTESQVQITQDLLPNADGTLNIGSASLGFATIYGESTSAQYADLAENYAADYQYLPGTVLSFGGDAEVTECKEEHSRNIVGIVSTDPGLLMNSKQEGEHVVAVALMGRVPCKVFGPIKRGDLLVSAGHGAARAEEDPKYGAIIGRAIEDFDGPSGIIEVLVGRV